MTYGELPDWCETMDNCFQCDMHGECDAYFEKYRANPLHDSIWNPEHLEDREEIRLP